MNVPLSIFIVYTFFLPHWPMGTILVAKAMGFAGTLKNVKIVPSAHFVIKKLTFFLEAEKSKRKAITAQCITQWSTVSLKEGIDNTVVFIIFKIPLVFCWKSG